MKTMETQEPSPIVGSAYDCPLNVQDSRNVEYAQRTGDVALADKIEAELSGRIARCTGAVMTYAGFGCCKLNGNGGPK